MTSAVEPMSVGHESYGDSAQLSDSMRGLEDDETQLLAESAMRMLALHAREKHEPRVIVAPTRSSNRIVSKSQSIVGSDGPYGSPPSSRVCGGKSTPTGDSIDDDAALADDGSEFEDLPTSGASSGGGGDSRHAPSALPYLQTAFPSAAAAAAAAAAIGRGGSAARPRVRKLARPSKVARLCSECGTGDTPSWRRGADGARTLCNACGLQFIRRVKKEERLEVLKNWRKGDPEPARLRGRPLEHPIPPPPRKRKAVMPSPPSPVNPDRSTANATPVFDLLASISMDAPNPPALVGAPWPPNTAFLLQVRPTATLSPQPARVVPPSLPSLIASIPTRKQAKTSDECKKPKSSVDFLLNSEDGEM